MTRFQLCLAAITVFGLATSADAATRYAGPWGYPTIQAAVDAAVPGDTVQIYPQVWRESVRITKSLTIEKLPTMSGTATIIGTTAGTIVLDVYDGQAVKLRNVFLQGSGGPVVKGPKSFLKFTLPSVTLESVVVWQGTSGVSGSMNLTMKAGGVYYSSGAGIAISGGCNLDGVTVMSTGGIGISVTYTSSKWNGIRNSRVLSPQNIGIRIDGASGGQFWMDEVEVDDALDTGIDLYNVFGGSLSGIRVTDTRGTSEHTGGHGILAWKSEVYVSSSMVRGGDGYGLGVFGCSDHPGIIAISDTDLIDNAINLVENPAGDCTMDAHFQNLGDVHCFEDGIDHCGALSSVIAVPDISPPAPPPPPPT